jgi:hypothetical protein
MKFNATRWSMEMLMQDVRPHGSSNAQQRDPDRMAAIAGFAILLLVCGAAGCGASMAEQMGHSWFSPPRGLPSFEVDLNASSVEYDGNNSPEVADAAELRAVVASQLRERLGHALAGPDVQSARFRAKYRVSRQVWPLTWWIFCFDLQIFGCPTGQATVDTAIDLQVGSLLYRGQGKGYAVGGLYYGRLTGTAGALAEATEDALRHLAYVGMVGGPTTGSSNGLGVRQ